MKLGILVRNAPALFWPPVAVLVLHALRVGLLPERHDLDQVAHFLGGFSIAWVAWNFHRFAKVVHPFTELPKYLLFLWIVSIAELVGVLWEFMEYYIAMPLGLMTVTLADTEWDLVMDLSGAVLFAVIVLVGFSRREWRLIK